MLEYYVSSFVWIFHENQFGFQINNSSEHAVLWFTQDITQDLHNVKLSLGVFIDLLKAFETVDYQILLNKSTHYGVNEKTLAWLHTYLFQRKQYIELLMASSIYLKLIVVSDRSLYLDHYFSWFMWMNSTLHLNWKIVIFVDDKNLFISNENIGELFKQMNKELKKVSSWFKASKLSVNIDKTK